ncbi:MAG TPA: M66 family metalloprotease, partial [Polyangiaceae bacterium]|nr:M66 family metalloprotease [Polyangiaceae bacterium]
AQVEITVHDPWPWNQSINASGAGMNTLLQAVGQLRGQDQADPDLYYYAAFDPTADFGSYCGGGCVTGLSNIGAPMSVGIGYGGGPAEDTAIHEVGHAHGLSHAPSQKCGIDPGGVDPAFPYLSGSIGVWGYDPFAATPDVAMIDPSKYEDMMSYCSPKWISDYFYQKVFTRVRSDNKYFNDWMPGLGPRYVPANIDTTVPTAHVEGAATREPWIAQGEPREVTWAGGKSVAYFFPYDHLPGGTLYVPDEVPSGARLRGDTITTILR